MLQNGQRYHEQKAAEQAEKKPEFPRIQKTIILSTKLAAIDEVSDLLGQLHTKRFMAVKTTRSATASRVLKQDFAFSET